MAKTQIRLNQMTGSFHSSDPSAISDSLSTSAKNDLNLSDMQGVLGQLASSIKRIHGGDHFSSAESGIFSTDIKPEANNSRVLGANIASSFGSSLSMSGITLGSGSKILRFSSISSTILQEAASGDFLAVGDYRATLAADPSATVTFASFFGSSLSTSEMGSTLNSSTTSIPFVSESSLQSALGTDIRTGDVLVIGSATFAVSSDYSSGASVAVSHSSGEQSVSSISGGTTTTLSAAGTSGSPGGIALTYAAGSQGSISGGTQTAIVRGYTMVRAGTVELNGIGRVDLDIDQDTSIRATTDDQMDFEVGGSDIMTLTDGSLVLKGSTPSITIGDAGAEDTKLVYDGNAVDMYMGLDDTDDKLKLGLGSAVGTTPNMELNSADRDVKFFGDIEVAGGKITMTNGSVIDSETSNELQLTEDLVVVTGDLKVEGEGIQAADGNERISLADALVLKDASGDAVVTLGASDLSTTLAGGLTVAGALVPSADDSFDLGTTSAAWQDLHMEGDVLMTDAGKVATAAGDLTLEGAGAVVVDAAGNIELNADGGTIEFKDDSTTYATVSSAGFLPGADDTYDLGSTSAAWQDLHMEGDVLMTDAGKVATAAGALDIDGAAGVNIVGNSSEIDITSAAAVDINSTGGAITLDAVDSSNFNVSANSSSDVQLSILASNSGSGAGNVRIEGDTVTIQGNLDVNGTTTTIDTTNVAISDHNIIIDRDNTTSAVIDGAGITMEGGSGDDITLQQLASGDRLELKKGSAYHGLAVGKLMLDGANDHIDSDGSGTITVTAAAGIVLDAATDIELNADGADIIFKDGSTEYARFQASGLVPGADDTFDLGSTSAAWQDLHLEGDVLMTDAGKVSTAAGALTLEAAGSSQKVIIDAAGDIDLDADSGQIVMKDDGTALFTFAANEIDVASGDLLLDVAGDILLNADGANIKFQDGDDTALDVVMNGTTDVTFDAPGGMIFDADGDMFTFKAGAAAAQGLDIKWTDGSSEWAIQSVEEESYIALKARGNGSQPVEALRIVGEGSSSVYARVASGVQLQFADNGEYVSSDGTDLTIASGGDVILSAQGANFKPGSNDQAALGQSGTAWSDLFLASEAVVNFAAGDVSLTHGHDLGSDNFSSLVQSKVESSSLVSGSGNIQFSSESNAQAFVAEYGSGSVVRFADSSSSMLVILSSYGGSGANVPYAATSGASFLSFSSINSVRGVTRSKLTATDSLDLSGHDGSSNGLMLGSTLVTSTAAELNLLDGGRSLDSSITIANSDGVLVNDGGTMKMVPASDLKTFVGGGRAKKSATMTAAVAADALVTVSGLSHDEGADPDLSDVYLNGQLMLSGSSSSNGDYQINGASGGSSLSLSAGDLASGQTFSTSTTSVAFNSAIGSSAASALPNGSDKVFVMENSAGTVRLEGDINGSLSSSSTSIAINNVRIFNPVTGASVSSFDVDDVSTLKAADSISESKVRFFFALEVDDVVTVINV